jgi:glycosyltransferase involved in cell wall biosynthesis
MVDMRLVPDDRPPLGRSYRVLHVHSGNIYGGVEVGLLALAELGPSRGIDPDFALCFEARSSAELRATGRPVHILGDTRSRYPWQVMRVRRKLGAILKDGDYDAVVTHNPWGLTIFGPAIRASKTPFVFHLHGTFKPRLDLIDRVARLSPPDLVMCNSEFSESTLDFMFPRIKRAVVYTPMRLREPATGARASLRREMDVADDGVVVLQACRLDGWKGHRLHLEALARLKTKQRWRSWFAGGPQRGGEQRVFDALVAYARELGVSDRVRFLGQRTDVPELLSAADVLCQPNTGPEPFGITFIEALSAGVPVVTSAMGGALEIVDATCGFLVAPEPDAIAGALAKLIDDPRLRASMCEPAKRRARDICDPDRQAALMRRAISSVARREGTL